MDYVELIGSVAGICTTICLVPQVLKVRKTRRTEDLSLLMYVVFVIGIFLWLIYGLFINSTPIIAANAVTLLFGLYILIMKLRLG